MPMRSASRQPGTARAAPDEAPFFALDRLRMQADRLARATEECLRQHERWALLCGRADVEDPECDGWGELVEASDRLLAAAVAAYERESATLRPDGDDSAWWHRANVLWHHAREWLRRHESTAKDAARARSRHTVGELGTLAVDGALEASALYALRQALDAYGALRPVALRHSAPAASRDAAAR